MKTIILISLCCLVFLLSCKKDKEDYPVIYPGPYFPVYPGSWWKYKTRDDQISIHSVESEYRINKYVIWSDEDNTEYSEPCYVPIYDGEPIYHYDKIDYGGAYPFVYCLTKWPILSEQIGFTFEKKWVDHRYTDAYEMVRVKEKYFNGMDSILVQEIYIYPAGYSSYITTQEYAKNIGLVRTFYCDTLIGDTILLSWLIDYNISFDSTSIDYE